MSEPTTYPAAPARWGGSGNMLRALRLAAALAVCLLLAGVVGYASWWSGWPARRMGPVRPRLAHRDCRECHVEVWAQWEASSHARSWKDPQVQAAFQHFGFDRKCESCHAPEPVLTAGPDDAVALRAEGRESGVNCMSCHQTADGRVAARRTVADAPCRPVAEPALGASRTCGKCHEAIYDDWKASRYRVAEQGCRECHMPAEQGRPGGVRHLCLGGHDEATVRSGTTMACRREGDELVVAVENHATGHNFPGERHNRVLLLQVIERDPAGRITLSQQQLIKGITPFRGESSAEKIRAGETFTARFPVVEPPVEADVRLLYKSFPWLADRDALVVHRAGVPLAAP